MKKSAFVQFFAPPHIYFYLKLFICFNKSSCVKKLQKVLLFICFGMTVIMNAVFLHKMEITLPQN